MISTILMVLTLILILNYYWKNLKYIKVYNKLKMDLTNFPIIGHSYLFHGTDEDRMQNFKTVGQEALKFGGIGAAWFANKLYIVVAEPVAAELILKNCSEKDYTMKYMQQLLGNGTITAPVPIWRIRRKILSASFSVKNLNGFVDVFANQSKTMTEQLKTVDSKSVPILKHMAPCAMDVVYDCVLGMKIETQKDPKKLVVNTWDEFRDIITARMCRPWLHFNAIYRLLPDFTKLDNQKKFLEGIADEVIQNKMIQFKTVDKSDFLKTGHNTFLEDLIRISQRIGGYNKSELQEETLVLTMAASDSSSVGASFTCLMLAMYPEVQQKVYEELSQVFGDSTRLATSEDLLNLKYLEAVIKETLRLHPPIPILVREIQQDITLSSGITIPKGSGSMINIWALHRNPRYWGPDADVFKAERFLNLKLEHPAQYMPFSYGPRSCLGPQFAMMLMKTLISTLLRSFKILPLNSKEETIRVKFDLTMKAVDGFSVHLEPRETKVGNK